MFAYFFMDVAAAQALSQTNFTSFDWVIVSLYLLLSLVIGIMVRNYIRDMTDYITAGRGIGTALGVATLAGTEMGLITIMYSSQKGFVAGFSAFHIALVGGIVMFIVGSTGFIIYRLRQMEILTIPEFYQRRFDRKTRILGGIMLAIGGILNMGLFLKVGSQFIVGITGMSHTGWALPLVMTLLLVFVLIYTTLGGMISVVITDYVQFVIISIGFIIGTVLAIYKLGWTHIFDTIALYMGEKGFSPVAADSSFGWEYVLWMCFIAGLVGSAVWPTTVARALAADSSRTVKKQFMWGSVSYTIRYLVPYFWGIAAFVYITTQAPQLKEIFFPASGEPALIDNIYAMPIFLGRILPAGLIGLITAAMIAAFMSTHDSYLLCWSSVITQDIIAPLFGDKLSTQKRILITRICIVLIGIYILYWGLIYQGIDDIWDYMAISGSVYAIGAFALLLGGLYWKRASTTGAFLTLCSGLLVLAGLGPVKQALGIPAEISSARVGLISIAISLAVLVVFSLLFPDKKEIKDV